MKLYVIRHGLTQNNVDKIFNGRYDEDINEIGIQQAMEASKKVKKLDIDLIICSPLLRTKHTADIINVNNIPIIYDELLVERDYGILTEKSVDSINRENIWIYNQLADYEGIEQVKDLFNRAEKFLNNIKEKYPNKNILVVTHGGIARGIYSHFNGIPSDNRLVNYGVQDNCEIKEYEW